MKNKKGITLIALIVTIFVMSMLLGVGTVATIDIIEKAEFQQVASNMMLIQTKVKILMEKASFNGSGAGIYIGTQLKTIPTRAEIAGNVLNSSQLESDYYYVYDQNTLNRIGLEGIRLKENEFYIVNYATGDVIYPTGVKDYEDNLVYKLSDFM